MKLWTVVIEHEYGSDDGPPKVDHIRADSSDEAVRLARKARGWTLDDSRILAVFAGWHDEEYHRGDFQMNKKTYRKPSRFNVPRSEAPRLYELEEQLHRAVERVADEWGQIASKRLGTDVRSFFTQTLPQALFDLLDSYDLEAARLAAEAYLEETHKAKITYKGGVK